MWTASYPLCPCVVGAWASLAPVKYVRNVPSFAPRLSSSPPHSLHTGAPSPWSACQVVCPPPHHCPPSATLYLPVLSGSADTALPDCSCMFLSAPHQALRSSPSCSCNTASPVPLTHNSTPAPCLLIHSPLPAPSGIWSYSIFCISSGLTGAKTEGAVKAPQQHHQVKRDLWPRTASCGRGKQHQPPPLGLDHPWTSGGLTHRTGSSGSGQERAALTPRTGSTGKRGLTPWAISSGPWVGEQKPLGKTPLRGNSSRESNYLPTSSGLEKAGGARNPRTGASRQPEAKET